MDHAAPTLLARDPWVLKRPITVAEYHRMGEVGILTEDDRVELIEGELIAMSPIGSPHFSMVNRLNRVLMRAVGDRAIVSIQNPIRLSNTNEPQPDAALLKPRPDEYAGFIARAEDAFLVVEVADSSLRYDRRTKRPLYGRHGIPEMWIIDLDAGEIEVCRGPQLDGYASVRTAEPDGVLDLVALPNLTIPVRDLIP